MIKLPSLYCIPPYLWVCNTMQSSKWKLILTFCMTWKYFFFKNHFISSILHSKIVIILWIPYSYSSYNFYSSSETQCNSIISKTTTMYKRTVGESATDLDIPLKRLWSTDRLNFWHSNTWNNRERTRILWLFWLKASKFLCLFIQANIYYFQNLLILI